MAARSSSRSGGGGSVLALDVGSSSVRASLYDDAGGALPECGVQVKYRWNLTPGGGMEIPAEELLEYTVHAIGACLERARAAGHRVAAVSTAMFWHSLVGVGPGGSPVTPVYAWGDNRAAGAALRLRERLSEAAVHRRTGTFLHPSYPSSKLLWLRETEEDTFRRTSAWLSFGEYLAARLFGELCSSLSMASGSGMLDIHRLRWDPDVLSALEITEQKLPDLVDVDEPFRGLRREFAARWPELANVPWYPALGDGACANVGSGATRGDRAGLTVGTSAALRVLWESDAVQVPEALWCYRLDRRRVVAGGALSNGGNGPAFLGEMLRLHPPSEWEEALESLAPDGHGLTVLPFLVGERGPGWREERQAALVGLTSRTPPIHVLRAWMEAIAYRLAAIAGRLEASHGPIRTVLASGGALHASSVWARIMADVLDRPVVLSTEKEATSRGAALVALEQLGWIEDLTEAPVPAGSELSPDPARHHRYRAAAARQQELAERLLPWLATHAPPASGGSDPE